MRIVFGYLLAIFCGVMSFPVLAPLFSDTSHAQSGSWPNFPNWRFLLLVMGGGALCALMPTVAVVSLLQRMGLTGIFWYACGGAVACLFTLLVMMLLNGEGPIDLLSLHWVMLSFSGAISGVVFWLFIRPKRRNEG